MTTDNPPAASRIPYAVPSRIRWGLVDCVMVVAAFLTAVVIGGLTLGLPLSADARQFWLGLLGYALMTAVVVYASFARGQRSLTADFRLAIRPVDVPIGLATGLGMRLATIGLTDAAIAVTGHSPDAGNYTVPTSTVWLWLSGVLLASVIAPFVEELVVRGLVLQSVRNLVLRWRGRAQPAEPAQQRRAMWISVVVSAIVFALLHAGQSTDALVITILAVATLALGVLNALLVYRTNRLGAGIVAHMTFNGSAIALAVLLPGP